MNIKANLLITGLILVLVFMTSMWWDARGARNHLNESIKIYEAKYDTAQQEIVADTALIAVNASKLKEKDDIIAALEKNNFELASQSRITVITDTIYVTGVADTVYTDGTETVYKISEVNNNYTMLGLIKAPSGVWSITVIQKPFGLEIREVQTPTGRKRIYANIIGRDDLQISDIEFFTDDVETKKEKLWGLGVGAIISDSNISWGASVRRGRLAVIGTKDSLASSFEIIRF